MSKRAKEASDHEEAHEDEGQEPVFLDEGDDREVRVHAPVRHREDICVEFVRVSRLTHRLEQIQFSRGPFLVGASAPDFTAPALVGADIVEEWTLSSLAGKYIVFFTYPLDWTFVCPTEILAFHDRIKEFQAIDCHVVGLSVDSVDSHFAWTQAPRKSGGLGGPLAFPLVSDLSHEVSADYGCLWNHGHTLRALFIIDKNFTVRHVTLNDDPVGRSVDETLRVVQAFQHHDANPHQVCPAGWTKGAPTITDNHKDKLQYFGSVNK